MPGTAGRRILVLGTSGSGKTTVGLAAAERLGVRFVELDSIRHQAGWVELPDEKFRDVVGNITAEDSWVIDGNYRVVRDLTTSRATQIVWVNPPLHAVMAQVVRRSLSRAVFRTELWNGNREPWHFMFRGDHPIRWAWTTYDRRQREYVQAMDARWIRLRSRHDVQRWLNGLSVETRS